MEGFFGIIICTLILFSMNKSVLCKDLGNMDGESALNLLKTGLQQFSQGIEKMAIKTLEGHKKVMEKKITSMMETITKKIVEEPTIFTKKSTRQFTANDEKIIDLLSSIQMEQLLFDKKFDSFTTNLSRNVKEIGNLLSTTQAEQQLLKQELVSLRTDLSGLMETTGDKVSGLKGNTTQTQQNDSLHKSFYPLTTEFSHEKLKLKDLINLIIFYNESFSTIQTEHRLFSKEMVSVATNLSLKFDSLSNNREIGRLKKAITELFVPIQKDLDDKLSKIESVLLTVNQTMSVCTTKMTNELDNIKTNLENVLRDGIDNFSIVHGNKNSKSENVLDDIRNTSLYVVERLMLVLEMIRQANNITGYDCAEILEKFPNTRGKDGLYNIITLSNKTKVVYCDMTTNNGGWLVIQRRVDGRVYFYRKWKDYKNGFGVPNHEFWIGNDILHTLTSLKPQELRIDMERFNGETFYAEYFNFSVGDEDSKYKLHVDGYSGNAGDLLVYNNDMKFTTRDQDNDMWPFNCAKSWNSGWWFRDCTYNNPNGVFIDSEETGASYIYWGISMKSLKTIQLMIRSRT